MFANVYAGKRVLVTGHTGFKGSWLSAWLKLLGAKVIGVSNSTREGLTLYSILEKSDFEADHRIDVRNYNEICQCIVDSRPDFIFHLAAQSLVGVSYSKPLETFSTNSLGTVNLLESIRQISSEVVAVFITSDKVYENRETGVPYKEDDPLGGHDPYSASKAMAEIALRSYYLAFVKESLTYARLGIGRAGNVIGGGDWSEGRLIPDCVRAWSRKEPAILRNPDATRPWQYVLEPLSGYLRLGQCLTEERRLNGQAFNFGPNNESKEGVTVQELLEKFCARWPEAKWSKSIDTKNHEAGLLSLDSSKATRELEWRPALTLTETAEYTADWYRAASTQGVAALREISLNQIVEYCDTARVRQITWAI